MHTGPTIGNLRGLERGEACGLVVNSDSRSQNCANLIRQLQPLLLECFHPVIGRGINFGLDAVNFAIYLVILLGQPREMRVVLLQLVDQRAVLREGVGEFMRGM